MKAFDAAIYQASSRTADVLLSDWNLAVSKYDELLIGAENEFASRSELATIATAIVKQIITLQSPFASASMSTTARMLLERCYQRLHVTSVIACALQNEAQDAGGWFPARSLPSTIWPIALIGAGKRSWIRLPASPEIKSIRATSDLLALGFDYTLADRLTYFFRGEPFSMFKLADKLDDRPIIIHEQ